MPDPREEEALSQALFRRLQIEPTEVVAGDRPDVRFRWDGKQIGMEVTMADPEEYRRIDRLSRDHPGMLDVSNLHDEHGRRRSTPEITDEVVRFSPVWTDVDVVWGRWARKVRQSYETKLVKLAHPDFERFDEDWLLISGLLGPGENEVEYHGATQALARELDGIGPRTVDFHAVYIHFESYLFRLRDGALQVNFKP